MGITTNINKVLKDIEKQQKKIQKAEVRALNRAGRDTQPQAKKLLRAKYNIKSSTINKAKQKPRKATKQRKLYLLRYQARRVNVKDYGLRQTKKGISWSVKKGRREKLLHGFKVGHNSPRPAKRIDKFGMIRTGEFKEITGTSKPFIKRETIKSVTGPSVPQLLKTKGVDRAVKTFFKKKFNKVLTSLLK